jgi:hypothetical protein
VRKAETAAIGATQARNRDKSVLAVPHYIHIRAGCEFFLSALNSGIAVQKLITVHHAKFIIFASDLMRD